MNAPASTGYSPQQNMQDRAILLSASVPVVQPIATVTNSGYPYTSGAATTINIPLRNVGVIRRLYLDIQMTIAQNAAETLTVAPFGPANMLSQVVVTDLQNQVRVQTNGLHLSFLNTARRRRPFGASVTTDTPFGIGSNYSLIKAPSPITTAQTVSMFYEIPFAYDNTDMRGALFANVVNATMNLQLTINPNLIVASGADDTLACYKSSTTDRGKVTSYTITVYQDYLDQLPSNGKGGYILPMLDMATQYNLINATLTGLVANSDFSAPYSNFRTYLSTLAVFDNGGTLNAGTDVNRWKLQTANSLNLFDLGPREAQLLYGRNLIGDDWPAGVYWFDHRDKPISTISQGNTQLLLNPSVVNAGASLYMGYEYFAMQSQLPLAGSIQSN